MERNVSSWHICQQPVIIGQMAAACLADWRAGYGSAGLTRWHIHRPVCGLAMHLPWSGQALLLHASSCMDAWDNTYRPAMALRDMGQIDLCSRACRLARVKCVGTGADKVRMHAAPKAE